jgi:hypothetical protein
LPNATPAAAARRRHSVRLPLVPLPKADFLAPAAAGHLAKRARQLLRSGQLTHREWALFDALLWSCRRPGQDLAVASYSALQKFVHIARGTVATALDKLEAFGLIGRIKRRVRVSWHQGGSASLQATSCYRLCPPDQANDTESNGRTVNRGTEILLLEKPACDNAEAARKALAAIAERRQALFNAEWARRRVM